MSDKSSAQAEEATQTPEEAVDGQAEEGTERPVAAAASTPMDSMPYTEPHHAPIFDTGPHPEPLRAGSPASTDTADEAEAEQSAPVVTAWAFSEEDLQWGDPAPVPDAAVVGLSAAQESAGPRAERAEVGEGLTENLNIVDLDAESLTVDPEDFEQQARSESGVAPSGPRHAAGRRGRRPAAAQPVQVPGAYQSIKLWHFALVLAGVWLVAAAIGAGTFYWWFHASEKTWPEFATLTYVVVVTVAALLVSMIEQRRPLFSGLALASMTVPFASGIGAAILYGMTVFKWVTL